MTAVDGTDATNGQTGVEALADRLVTEMDDLDYLRGVGYYSPEGCDTVYLRSDVRHGPDDHSRALEDAVLESIGAQTLEDYFDDDLTGTIRSFETKVVIYSCAATHRGVVASFDREPGVDYVGLLSTLERLTDAGLPAGREAPSAGDAASDGESYERGANRRA
ncbi:hypothetical protein [Halorussus halobius]|uniref:hypothetical protein n=1 Tax=Halorussus halobius TaxID=1710537 RepID=UPI001091C983|nr:hypothetical protein [Halorussus halobius]